MAFALYKVKRLDFISAEYLHYKHLSNLRYDHVNPEYFRMKMIVDLLSLQICQKLPFKADYKTIRTWKGLRTTKISNSNI